MVLNISTSMTAPLLRPCAIRAKAHNAAMKITQIVCQILRLENVQAKTASCQDAVIVRVR